MYSGVGYYPWQIDICSSMLSHWLDFVYNNEPPPPIYFLTKPTFQFFFQEGKETKIYVVKSHSFKYFVMNNSNKQKKN